MKASNKSTDHITKEFLDGLQHKWTAVVEQNNGIRCTIWYTAWPMTKSITKSIVSVSSDLPKRTKM